MVLETDEPLHGAALDLFVIERQFIHDSAVERDGDFPPLIVKKMVHAKRTVAICWLVICPDP